MPTIIVSCQRRCYMTGIISEEKRGPTPLWNWTVSHHSLFFVNSLCPAMQRTSSFLTILPSFYRLKRTAISPNDWSSRGSAVMPAWLSPTLPAHRHCTAWILRRAGWFFHAFRASYCDWPVFFVAWFERSRHIFLAENCPSADVCAHTFTCVARRGHGTRPGFLGLGLSGWFVGRALATP